MLTDREKQTLRLLLVGHDAKSLARHFGLSVHTINERLRDARRKLSVSSSKEAARLLREIEGEAPQNLGDMPFGGGAAASNDQHGPQPHTQPRHSGKHAGWVIGGLAMMVFVAAMLAVSAPVPTPLQLPGATAPSPMPESAVSEAARDWLALLDHGKWRESWAATSASFRSLNTVDAWQAASERVRSPLGQVRSRTLLSVQDTPAPPNGYTTVRFRTDFASRSGAIETLSLSREDGAWKVVGIYVE